MDTPAPTPARPEVKATEETVLAIHHWTPKLLSFRCTRPAAFRFRSGEFVMIGLPNAERPVYRAYSIASPSWDDPVNTASTWSWRLWRTARRVARRSPPRA